MKSTNKVVGAAIATLVFIGLLFLTPLKNSAPSESVWTLIVMALAVISLICLVVFGIQAIREKKAQ
jgi:hypothetical protein